MVITLIVSLFLQGSMGLLMSEWIDGKALVGRSTMGLLADIHAINALVLMALSVIHILAVIIYRLKGQRLVTAMITGKINSLGQFHPPKIASNHRALAWLCCSIALVAAVIKLLT